MKKITLTIPLPDKCERLSKNGNFYIWNADALYNVLMPDGSVGQVSFQVMSKVTAPKASKGKNDKLKAVLEGLYNQS